MSLSEISEIPVSQKIWSLPDPVPVDEIRTLAIDAGISQVLARLLAQRGIKSKEEALAFLNPSAAQLHNPFLMDGMEQAVHRISCALSASQKIMIYGDYDVDGTTSVALMMRALTPVFGNHVSFYIPDRYKEGYGISNEGIEHAASLGCSLIIALDCGIRSSDKVEFAKTKNIDFIICDHHLPGETIPDATAVLDPKKPGCQYPYKELSGAAIGFKLLQALFKRGILNSDPSEYLDLVALSIGADIVEMKGENRVLAHLGLAIINQGKSPAINKMLLGAEKDTQSPSAKAAGISDLVFKAAPLINAAGRIQHGSLAVEFLMSTSPEELNSLYSRLIDLNKKRSNLDKQITDEALLMIRSSDVLRSAASTVLFHKEWHKGVVGIVASRVIEKYYRPTIILTESNGKITGSARSVKGFDIHNAIAKCASLLLQYGGHQAAAGLTLLPENLDQFRVVFEQVVSDTLQPISKTEEVSADLELQPAEMSFELYKELMKLAPFGPGNMTPVFIAKGLTDSGWAKIVGTTHLKMKLGEPGSPFLDAIAFGQAHHYDAISGSIPVDVCYTLDENHWNGKVSLQMLVKDIKH